ncbi:sigma 54-interacting transcriptional regulator [Dehalobacter sp. DCM]|uniref:sigma-54 interaction domain-containing protein n=1 Tax=Dehalobacter sp. DCM TaxID=2907827 RepID=UPI003081290C|nr:sigma 54-interacting transcriptional regulator [Dehalobacter sp. DCM]
MNNSDDLEKLRIILPILAKTSGGYATITDLDGKRLYTIDWNGNELESYRGEIYELAREAAQRNEPQIGYSQIEDQADAWALKVGNYVLSCSNVERIKKEQKFVDALVKALPMIAQVAGGEAVIFNERGERLYSFFSDGKERHELRGQISDQAKQAMLSQEPFVGKSFSTHGAMAVRIPITEKIGFGFNNEKVVSKQQKLYDEVKKFQSAKYRFEDIIGESEQITKTKTLAKFIAEGVSSILIYGETGTGKELFAQSIHNASERRYQPFIAINCGALPASLIESNLFGYEEGAFTGAKKGGSVGAFEQANGGTIFLDEISELEFGLQTKLLRVLQEREVVRVGGFKAKKVDVRVIASTNKQLAHLIGEGKFRDDLYYRLNVVQLTVPPLRERQDDVILLTRYFINKYAYSLGKAAVDIDDNTLTILKKYYWPGNVRELQNCIESAMNMIRGQAMLLPEHLPLYLWQGENQNEALQINFNHESLNLQKAVIQTEKMIIKKALEMNQYKKAKTAEVLGISTPTLWRKLTEYGIE